MDKRTGSFHPAIRHDIYRECPVLTERLVRETIEAHPNLIGIFADNDRTGVGTAKGIRASGSKTVFAYAFDANEEEIQAVEAGDLKGMIVQKPFEMGYRVVRTALDVLEGKPVERFVDTGGDKRESE
ncbi:MAG: substrate-binding domain-containing protein [Lachnospiraceae bacterium]|nr:substrate-binding domain-containing protein [Lachnospiraceae bacterium]